MADFNPVQRPVPHEDDSHKKDKKTVASPEKFKESYRVQEVKPTGEEEKKKRKRSDEAQMEAQAEGLVNPQQVPLQTNLSPSPYSVQPPTKRVGSVQSTSAPQQSAPLGSSYSPTAQSVGAPTSTPIPDTTPTAHTTPTQAPPPAATPAPTATPAPYVAQPTPQPTSYEEVEPAGQDYFQPTVIPSPSQPITTSQPTSAETEQTDESQQTDDSQKTDDTSDTTQSQQPTSKDTTDKTQNKKGVPLGMEKAMTGTDALAAGTEKVGLSKETKPLGTDKTSAPILDKKETPGEIARPTSTTAIESSEVKMESGSKETSPKTGLEKMPDSSQLQKGSQETKSQATQQQALTTGETSDAKPVQVAPPPPATLRQKDVTDAKPVQVAPPPPATLRQKDVTVKEAGLSWEGDVQPTSALSSESSDKEKKDKNDRDNEGQNPESQTQSSIMQTPTPFAIETPGVQAAPPTYTTFSPAVLEMFDKMVGTISVLQETSGERKTTISLTSQNFSSSVFYGAEIVIEEDLHLAPGQFNIKLIGSPEAVNLFQAKRNDLMAAFQEGNYNFRVQRLETAIQSSDKPLFKRKEAAGEDTSKDSGGEE